jgi:hypothetical protein
LENAWVVYPFSHLQALSKDTDNPHNGIPFPMKGGLQQLRENEFVGIKPDDLNRLKIFRVETPAGKAGGADAGHLPQQG